LVADYNSYIVDLSCIAFPTHSLERAGTADVGRRSGIPGLCVTASRGATP